MILKFVRLNQRAYISRYDGALSIPDLQKIKVLCE